MIDTYATRREALRPKLAAQGLTALIVSHAANRFYLSGFELKDAQCNESSGWLVVTADGPDWLLTDSRYEEAAKRLWDPARLHIYKMPKLADIRGFLRGLGLATIGFEAAGLSFSDHAELARDLSLTPTRGLVEELRLVKDETEIAAMRRSAALNHAVFGEVPGILVPGRSEAEIAWELEQRFRNRGASALSFSTIVGVGPNAALPHAVPGATPVRANDLVLVDMGCRLDNYCSDQTRTFWVGETPSDRFKRVKEQVREAQNAALSAVRPDVAVADLYAIAHATFEKYGVAGAFTHALGHGVGLETHEPPSLAPRADMTLKPGMIVTIEPGLYYPDWGGIRWEYMVLVTEDGAETL